MVQLNYEKEIAYVLSGKEGEDLRIDYIFLFYLSYL